MRQIKFRVPTRCQNGHFRWMFLSLYRGETHMTWGQKDCNCPTHGIDNGFDPIGDDEQFTGLLDKNGIEIYERDIVKSKGYNNQIEVKYDDIQASDDMTAPGVGFQFPTEPSEMEIIGNIWENPSLLK